MTRNVPLSYTIDISVSTAPTGLGEQNTNTVCLLTNEQPLSTEPFIWAVNAQDAINEYGTNSLTAKMAQALFTPVPNLRTGNGQVLIFPYNGVNATCATTTTIAITAEVLNSLKLVSNGDIQIAIDGEDYLLSGLNFTKINSVKDIVQILNSKYLDCNIEVVDTNKIQFKSRNFGDDSAIEIKPASESIITNFESETITNVETDSATFKEAVDEVTGTYNFIYTTNGWTLNSEVVVITDYGITITGTPSEGDDITVTYTAATGTGTDLYGSSYFDGANQVTTNGVSESGTTISEALAAAEEVGYFGGVLTTQYLSNDGVVEFANTIQSKDHIYYEAINSLKNISTLGTAIKAAGLRKTRLLAKTDQGEQISKVAIATYATIAQSTNYSGAGTALTMNLKELTGVLPDYNINSTYYNIAKQNGVDIYATTEGLSCVYSFDNGYYTDDATNLLWLKKALEVSGFNYLRKTNTKIPQTETGMTGLKNAYEQRCSQGVRNGVIGTGLLWNDSIPFGDPEDFQRNIQEKGYYIYSLPIALQNQAEREQRVAPVVQIAIKLSGAIHNSNVIVQVQR